ncbi:MAG: hypothetical protein V5A50_07990 [Thiohalorhabdus sp.]
MAMVIVAIFAGGVYVFFINFMSQSSEQAALSKRTFAASTALQQFRRDLRMAGFGIPTQDMDPGLPGADSNSAVTSGPGTVTILSTAVHSRAQNQLGAHGVVRNGNATNDLDQNIGNNVSGIAMNAKRDNAQVGTLGGIDLADGHLFFAGPGGNPGNYYYRRQYLVTNTTPQGCAPGSGALAYNDQPPNQQVVTQPILDCVLALRVVFGYQLNGGDIGWLGATGAGGPAGAVDNRPDVLKVGMAVQIGHEYRNQIQTPGPITFNDPVLANNVGSVPLANQAQQSYRWQTLEWTVPLVNMP